MTDSASAKTSDGPNVQAAIDKFIAVTGSQVAAYLDACIHCGQCAQACHFHEVTHDPKYVPANKLVPITKVYKRHKAPFAALKRAIGLAPAELTADDLTEWQELLYDSCTMCGRCTVVCPMGIDIASIVGLMGSFPSQIAYTASKGGVIALTRELGVALARRGIRVNAIAPGVTATRMGAQIVKDDEAWQLRRLHIPMGRLALPDEIAAATAFLASDEASYLTAQCIAVDGGMTGAYLSPPD